MLFLTKHESPGDLSWCRHLTLHVHNHQIIIATELQMDCKWMTDETSCSLTN